MKKYPNLCRSIIFLIILSIILSVISEASMRMAQEQNPVYSSFSRNLFAEPEDTIDVLALGTSNFYSGISPLEWWNQYGITGYSWGEASQRIGENYLYLKEIYKKQKPKVVFMDVATMFWDTSDFDNLETVAKSTIAQFFPVIVYHRFLGNPDRLYNLTSPMKSLTKGYLIRPGRKSASRRKNYMKKEAETPEVPYLTEWQLKKCIDFCKEQGSEVVLLAVPAAKTWDKGKHRAVEALSKKLGVRFLDMNMELAGKIKWKSDTPDKGSHMNYRGAEKVSRYLGDYLHENYDLTDHRSDKAYSESWDTDYKTYAAELERLKHMKKSSM